MKHLENFKSEYIQGIYDFLEQDADVSGFKRDLIAISEYKKIPLHDLEAQYFEYHDLMKQDLSDKIVFIFREDGYLGMFGDIYKTTPIITINDYDKLRTGDKVSVTLIKYWPPNDSIKYVSVSGVIFEEPGNSGWVCIVQDLIQSAGGVPDNDDWKKYGKKCWWIYCEDVIIPSHENLKVISTPIDNLIIKESEIEGLKNNMHFSLIL